MDPNSVPVGPARGAHASIGFLAGIVVVLALKQPRAATGQLPGLNAGTVTTTVDDVPFLTNASITTVDDERKLVLPSRFAKL